MSSILSALHAFFPAQDIYWRPGSFRGARVKALACLRARSVQDRLDSVVGVAGWQTSFQVTNLTVTCTLQILLDGKWVAKADGVELDVSAPAKERGARIRAAYGEALVRAASAWGIGRYLYETNVWVPAHSDGSFAERPTMPEAFLPKAEVSVAVSAPVEGEQPPAASEPVATPPTPEPVQEAETQNSATEVPSPAEVLTVLASETPEPPRATPEARTEETNENSMPLEGKADTSSSAPVRPQDLAGEEEAALTWIEGKFSLNVANAVIRSLIDGHPRAKCLGDGSRQYLRARLEAAAR